MITPKDFPPLQICDPCKHAFINYKVPKYQERGFKDVNEAVEDEEDQDLDSSEENNESLESDEQGDRSIRDQIWHEGMCRLLFSLLSCWDIGSSSALAMPYCLHTVIKSQREQATTSFGADARWKIRLD